MLSTLLTACGGGSSSSSSGSSSISAQFIDSPVKGLNVEKASGNTISADQGRFNCEPGETVKFKIRDFIIGQGPCGAKIFLDDVVPAASANRIAAVIQSLSTTAASSGLIDLSAIPSTQVLSGLDLTSDSNLDATLTTLKNSIPATFVINVSPANARIHANAQLAANAPTGDFLTVLNSIKASSTGIRLLASRTSGNPLYCNSKIAFKLQLEGTSPIYKTRIVDAIASEDGREICTVPDMNADLCYETGGSLLNIRKIITSPVITVGQVLDYAVNITSTVINSQEIKYARATAPVLNGQPEIEDHFFTDVNNNVVSVDNIKAYFPFNFQAKEFMSLDLSKYPVVSGSAFSRDLDLEVTDYVSTTSYTLVKQTVECGYSISQR